MIQEYLFVDSKDKAEVQKYNPDPHRVKKEMLTLKATDCWIVSYHVDGENMDSANILSAVNSYIVKNYTPIVLTNESSAYYNKRLFPYANEFERKLRKLLYLKSVINKDDATAENIKSLEEKDLGKIFELLFTDDSFMAKVRETMKNMTGKFTKSQIAAEINSIDESPNWDHLIGEDVAPTLKAKHQEVRSYRNDIMHAHNISAEIFQEAKKLFESVNQQLDVEIGLMMGLTEKHSLGAEKAAYNRTLKTVLEQADAYAKISDFIKYSASSELIALQNMARQQLLTPEYIKLQEMANAVAARYPKIESELLEFQKACIEQAALDLYLKQIGDEMDGRQDET